MYWTRTVSYTHLDVYKRQIVNDVDSVSDGLLQGFTQLFTGVITILGTLGFMISINPWIALVVVALTPVSLVIATLIARGTHTTFLKQSRIQGELSGHVEEMLSGQKLVKLFGHEKASEEKLEEINQRLYVWGYKAQIYPAFTNPLTRFVNGLVYVAVGVAGALAAVGSSFTLMTFLTSILLGLCMGSGAVFSIRFGQQNLSLIHIS